MAIGKRVNIPVIGVERSDNTDPIIALSGASKVKIALLGDSRTSQCHNSIRTQTQTFGYAYWAVNAAGGRVDFPAALNFGVAGQTSTQILSRVDSVLNADCDAVVVLCSTNDRTTVQPMTANESISNIDSIIDKITSFGKKVFLIAEMPRGDSTFTSARLTATELQKHLNVVQWCIEQQGRPNVYVVNPWPFFAVSDSTTGDAVLGLTTDGLHESIQGAKIIGDLLAEQINMVYPPYDFLPSTNSDLFDAVNNPRGNLITNGMLSGTTLATGWTELKPAGLVTTVTVKTDSEGVYQEIVLSGTPTAANPIYEFRREVTTYANTQPGDATASFGRVDVLDGATGYLDIGIGQRAQYAIAAAEIRTFGDAAPGLGTPPSTAHTIIGRCDPLVHPEVPTGFRTRVTISLFQNVAVSMTIKVRAMALRKVLS